MADNASQLDAYEQVRQMLQGMQSYPLGIAFPMMGMNSNTFMTKVGGLSAARVSQGNFDQLRPSTLEKVNARSQAWALNVIREQGWPEDVGRTLLHSMPVCSHGREALFAGFLHGMQRPDGLQLPLSIEFSLALDELIYALLDAHKLNDCILFGDLVVQFLNQHKWSELESLGGKKVEDYVQEWVIAASWETVQPLADRFLMEVLQSFFAAVDVEWSSYYFSGCFGAPVLPLVAPKLAENFQFGEKIKPTQPLVRRPVRRLFEVSATLIYRMYFKEWPVQKPTARQLAKWMCEDEEVVYNYLDGSKLLTFDDFQERWEAMLRWIPSEKQQDHLKQISVPNLLVVFAVGWQATLIKRGKNKKIQSIVFFDDEISRHWQMYRRRWQDQLQRADEQLEWPEWLN